MNDDISRACGNSAWIKGFTRFGFREAASGRTRVVLSKPAGPVEVLALHASFEKALAASRHAAREQNLRIHLNQLARSGGSPVIDIELSGERGGAGKWRLREVPRLFRAAIVIDDLGQNMAALNELLELPYPITFSVLPHLRYSRQSAEDVHSAGREVMLHLPMEAEPGRAGLGAGAIRVGMAEPEVEQTLDADLASISFAQGVNNHEGSRATTDPRLMVSVMRNLARHRLFFIDSRTTAGTVAYDEARQAGVPSFFRSVFLDNTSSMPYTLAQLERFHHMVKERGAALAIGHPHPSTIAALRGYLPQLERDDIELVPASELVRLPEIARLTPPRPVMETAGGNR